MDTKILCILDGFGLSDEKNNNAIYKAKTPNIDMIFDKFHMVKGEASGEYVGLPKGQMGNSEVGHLNIGAGRVIYQELTRISKSIQDGDFYNNKILLKAIENAKNNNNSLHICGLLSDGGVHSHIEHLYGLLKLAKKNNIKNVYIHAFLDGRDTDPNSGLGFIKNLNKKIENLGVGKIVSICGRYYAMDRDKNYDRTSLAYNLMVKGEGEIYDDPIMALEDSYKNNITDEFVKPIIIDKNNIVKDNDSIIFFNFRPDRARQITRAFVDDDFTYFDRIKLKNLCFVCMVDYDENIKNKLVAYEKEDINDTLGEVISKKGLYQLRCAETEKYAHVTFFFNGGKEEPYKNEDRILVPSPKDVATYDLKPEMSAYEVCDNVLKGIESKKYSLIVVNFANSDMVGHTGVMDSAIKAVETIDQCIGKIYQLVEKYKYDMMIIADHGNSEKMIDENGKPFTAHTSNPVPFCLVNFKGYKLIEGGKLSDIAPTILELMNIDKPEIMSGKSLLVK